MAKKPLSFIPPKSPHTEAPKKEAVTVSITAQQVEGIKFRQQAANAAAQDLNSFIGGIVTGHGHDAVQVTGFDAEKATLTFFPIAVDKPVERR